MKSTIRRIQAAIASGIIVLCIDGCSNHNQNSAAVSAGESMQKGGIMSQADYVRIRGIADGTSQSHSMSESDLTFSLSLLRKANNSVGRARAMTAMSEINPMSPIQKAEIIPAVAPFLQSPEKLDQLEAQKVMRAAR